MTPGEFASGLIWLLVAALGIGTFALRLSFIQAHAWIDEFPPTVERSLAFIPAAVLAALVFPELLPYEALVSRSVLSPELLAGGVAAVVAWRTESMIATIAVGMGVLWAVTFALG